MGLMMLNVGPNANLKLSKKFLIAKLISDCTAAK
jgi:hypothetical protein